MYSIKRIFRTYSIKIKIEEIKCLLQFVRNKLYKFVLLFRLYLTRKNVARDKNYIILLI